MAENEGVSAAGQQSLYPPPPEFYRLYRDDADGTAERPLGPLPPQPVEETYQIFGEMHTVGFWSLPLLLYYVATQSSNCNTQVEPGIPALQAQSLFHTMANGSIGMRCPAIFACTSPIDPMRGYTTADQCNAWKESRLLAFLCNYIACKCVQTSSRSCCT